MSLEPDELPLEPPMPLEPLPVSELPPCMLRWCELELSELLLDPVPDVECFFLCFFFDVVVVPLPDFSVLVDFSVVVDFSSGDEPVPVAVSDEPADPAPEPMLLPVSLLPLGEPVADEPPAPGLPVVESEEPVPPIVDEPLFELSLLDEPLPIDDDDPEEPPLIDEPLPPDDPEVPPLLLCADATPTPSAARAPAKNNRSLSFMFFPLVHGRVAPCVQ